MQLIKVAQSGVDHEARYLIKGKKLHFGYKKQVLVDENGLQLSVHTTTANEHDSKGLKPCLENQDEELAITACFTDKGYQVPNATIRFTKLKKLFYSSQPLKKKSVSK